MDGTGARDGGKIKEKREGGILETIKVVVQALLIALVVRTVLFQPFNIPSGSLIPTLLIGDYLFVSKYSYGYSRYSFPFEPAGVLGPDLGRRAEARRHRRLQAAEGQLDRLHQARHRPARRQIQVIGGILHINGQPVKRERIDDYETQDAWRPRRQVPQYRETLPNGVAPRDHRARGRSRLLGQHRGLHRPAGPFLHDGRQPRQLDRQSRDLASVGYVPFENFVGRAEIIFFSIDEGASAWQVWEWPWTVRWQPDVQPIR